MPAVDKDILKLHVDQAKLNGMAFWLGFANGFLNEVFPKKVKIVSAVDERLYAAVEQVYRDVFGKYKEYTPQVALKLKSDLELNGVGATDEGLKYLWDGFVLAQKPEEGKPAEAAHARVSRLLDDDIKYLVRQQREDVLRKLETGGVARVDGIVMSVVFEKNSRRPGYWQATVTDEVGVPLGDFTARSAEEIVDVVIGVGGGSRNRVAEAPQKMPEKKEARWLRQENYEDTSYEVYCSNCFKLNGKKEAEECPNCGAKMVDVNPKKKED